MKILALNLYKLGPDSSFGRPANLVRYLSDSKADVLVLSEFKKSLLSRPFKEGLAAAGYPDETCFATALEMGGYLYKSVSDSNGNSELGVAIFSRRQARPVCLDPPSKERRRIAALRVEDVAIAGVYFPNDNSKGGRKKFPLFDYLLSVPKSLSSRSIVMGDYNTGRHEFDETGATLAAQGHFSRMDECGWVDLWRAVHGDRREYSWTSKAGNDFRLDHAFARNLKRKVADCYYDHGTRSTGGAGMNVSDHSAMIVELE